MQQEVNIKIGDTAPATYMAKVFEQCQQGVAHYGAITNLDDLKANLAANCLPDDLTAYQPEQLAFLAERRRLMAQKIKQYYWGL